MNFLFISPQFPREYWNFCERLKRNGANVCGIGDTPYDNISWELKQTLSEYYWLPSLENYDEVYRACAYLSYKHGKFDWIESNNEYWLALDAQLRDDFNVKTGAGKSQLDIWQSKASMKPLYAAAHVPSARQITAPSLDKLRAFAKEVGYPLFAKPERGMGSGGVCKIRDEHELETFLRKMGDTSYVIEEYIEGDICSWDAILDSHGDVLFENQEEFPPSMADVVAQKLDMSYLSKPTVDPKLSALGRATAKSFGLTSRFVHMEFFRLTKTKPGLGKKGDYLGLEVNVRPPGGFTPEMMNVAHTTDVYQIWADMICFDERRLPESKENAYCVYVGRRDGVRYKRSHDELCARYYDQLVMVERIDDALSDDLGNQSYVAKLSTPQAVSAFKRYAMERA